MLLSISKSLFLLQKTSTILAVYRNRPETWELDLRENSHRFDRSQMEELLCVGKANHFFERLFDDFAPHQCDGFC